MLKIIKKYYNDHCRGRSLLATLKEAIGHCRKLLIENRYKFQHLSQTNFDLAVYHFDNGDIRDALFRLRLLRWFGVFSPGAHYYMGRCYMGKFQYNKAKRFFTEYTNSGDGQFSIESLYCLKIIDKQRDIDAIPLSIIVHNFDKMAKYCSPLLLNKNNALTSVQRQIHDIIETYLTNRDISFVSSVLDLGCGPGILGQYLRQSQIANILIGVDASSKMLEIAKSWRCEGAKTYSKVIHKDIREFCSQSKDRNTYDMVLATGLIPYFTDIQGLLSNIDRLVAQEGLLVLSFARSTTKEKSFIANLDEFRYSRKYVEDIVAKTNWIIQSAIDLAPENVTVLLLDRQGKNDLAT
jgi:predicted TPR repeat methyltransferase